MKLLFLCMGVACLFDLWQYRIPNLCIICGLAGKLLLCIQKEPENLWKILIQIAVVFCFFYPFYLLKGLGAGDIKLFMMMAAYLTQDKLIKSLLLTFMLAAVVSVIKMIANSDCRRRLFYFFGYLRKLLLTGAIDTYEVDKTKKNTVIRLALPAFFSVVWICAG